METNNAEINLDHRTRPEDLFSHQIYDLFQSDCARAPNRSLGDHHESRIAQLDFVPSGKLTPAHNHRLGRRKWRCNRSVKPAVADGDWL